VSRPDVARGTVAASVELVCSGRKEETMPTQTAARVIDGRGKTITTYVVFAIAEAMRSMEVGEAVDVLTDEFEAFIADIPAWCETTGHVLLVSESVAEGHRFVIQKSRPLESDASLAMVISDPGLEELLSPLGFALAAALEGAEVHLYFQGPAVRVLKRGYHPKLSGWGRPFSRLAAAGMAKTGHIAAHDKLIQLRSLGAKLYVCGGSLQPFKVRREDLVFDDVPIIEYLSFMPILQRSSVQWYA
jgi:predicted peroxiredoxin